MTSVSNEEIKKLIKSRGIHKGSLTRFVTFLGTNPTNVEVLKNRIRDLESIFYKFDEAQSALELVDENEAQARESFEQSYYKVIDDANNRIKILLSEVQASSSSSATEFSNLIKRRDQLKVNLEKFVTFVDTNPNKLRELELRSLRLEPLFCDFDKVQAEIEILDEGESTERDNFEDLFYDIRARVEDLIRSRSQNHNSASTNIHVPLPVVSLPCFNGDYTKWTTFVDGFNSLINQHPGLSAIQKFQLLKSSLKDEAQKAIETLPLVAENYDTAWELLRGRFENKRLIVQQHIQYLHNLPVANKNSPSSLRRVIDEVKTNLRHLKLLGLPTESWDALVIYLISVKIDYMTKRDWESSLKSNQLPTLDQFLNFLAQRCQTLEAIEFNSNLNKTSVQLDPKTNQRKPATQRGFTHVSVDGHAGCSFCAQNHIIFKCKEFFNLSVDSRKREAVNRKLCLNCLRPGHRNYFCKSNSCQLCHRKHNTLLHKDERQVEISSSENIKPLAPEPIVPLVSENIQPASTSEQFSVNNSAQIGTSHKAVLLSTALVNIMNKSNAPVTLRALLDSGSDSNFITEEAIKKLGLSRSPSQLTVYGINGSLSTIKSSVTVTLNSRNNEFSTAVVCHIIPKITKDLPLATVDKATCNLPTNVNLADENFNRTLPIDLLLGNEIFLQLLCPGKLVLGKGQPILQNTELGWILGGQINTAPTMGTCCISVKDEIAVIDQQLSKFWEIEQYNSRAAQSAEEIFVEDHFAETHKRLENGRFQVQLPFKNIPPKLGCSEQAALKRFYNLEAKFKRNPQLKVDYSKFMEEYLSLGHMELISNKVPEFESYYYLPHHAVLKEDSITTKLRVVFDGSAKTVNSLSLNDNLLPGPVLQADLFGIVIKFRTHKFVLTADIEKMYRQIIIDPVHRDYQLIFWRDNPKEKLNTYRLTTLTYGISAAPYLAIKCIHQLAIDEAITYPLATPILKNNFFVDDLLYGSDSLETLLQTRDQLIKVLERAGFRLRKWASNVPEALPEDNNNNNHIPFINLDKQEDTKTLGLRWIISTDYLGYSFNIQISNRDYTKRNILSIIAQIYDPLGLIGPVIVKAKILLQKLWVLKLDWDDTLPENFQDQWRAFLSELPHIKELSYPRHVLASSKPKTVELHSFCDSSQQAYGAVIFLKTLDENNITSVKILCAKSRVAPVKSVTLPRLELCGALLAAQLTHKIVNILGSLINRCFYWTDSTIVLSWLAAGPSVWKPFVANRVGEIHILTDVDQWYHIKGTDNPADLISRGSSPLQLKTSKLWKQGPTWLAKEVPSWDARHISKFKRNSIEIPERRAIVSTTAIINSWDVLTKFSSFERLVAIIAYCRRFIKNTKVNTVRLTGALSVTERNEAQIVILRSLQKECFSPELRDLRLNECVAHNSKIKSLNPFLDSHGLIRVGGRLLNSNLKHDNKYPIVMPSHHVTKLIIRTIHILNLHSGQTNTLAQMRHKYWPLSGRSIVRQVIHNCIVCSKYNPKSYTQLMGHLPKGRVQPSRPFSITGVDYAGPLLLKESRGRGKRTIKSYIALFVCFSTKAIHLELVTDLTTQSFLAALQRMIARRGNITELHSDNATNFVGANREFKKFLMSKKFSAEIIENLAKNSITWKFIPPRSPHFGSIWEIGVKSVKGHLRRLLGQSLVTFDEMYTILTRIEAVLNSRPLTILSEDPNDLNPLTPGHFLIGSPLTGPPEDDVTDVMENRLTRWQRVILIYQTFWKRWSAEYLTQLQQRIRWNRLQQNPKVGTVVLIKDDNLPPLNWVIGRITELHPGPDGLVRVVSVRTKHGITKRATTKVCPLPANEEV